MSFLSRVTQKLQAHNSSAVSKATGSSSKPAKGVTLEGLPHEHIYNAEKFKDSAAIPANHPNKADLIRAAHAGGPLEVREGVFAYPMSWTQEKIRTHWNNVKADPQKPYVPPDAFGEGKGAGGTERPRRSQARPPAASMRAVQDFSSGGSWFRDFKDRGVSTVSFFSNTPGSKLRASAVVGGSSDAATLVLRDSKGNEVARRTGVEVSTMDIVFTADGKPPADAGRSVRTTLYLKAGEKYSLQGVMDDGNDWFRMQLNASMN